MYYQSVAVATSLLHLHDDKIQQNFSRSLRATPESTLYVVWSKVAEQYLREETYRIFKGEMIIVRITRINEYCNNTRNIYFAYSYIGSAQPFRIINVWLVTEIDTFDMSCCALRYIIFGVNAYSFRSTRKHIFWSTSVNHSRRRERRRDKQNKL